MRLLNTWGDSTSAAVAENTCLTFNVHVNYTAKNTLHIPWICWHHNSHEFRITSGYSIVAQFIQFFFDSFESLKRILDMVNAVYSTVGSCQFDGYFEKSATPFSADFCHVIAISLKNIPCIEINAGKSGKTTAVFLFVFFFFKQNKYLLENKKCWNNFKELFNELTCCWPLVFGLCVRRLCTAVTLNYLRHSNQKVFICMP